jgi:NAD dependent epimerase/dehydratase family enzyme
MLLPFRLGLGGKLGSGRQWFSWIHIDDLVAAVLHSMDGVAPPFPRPFREGGDLDVITQSHQLLERRALSLGLPRGPVNMVAPDPVTNAEFTKTLAKVLRRPAFFAVPAFVARLAFGEFADAGLLSSAKVTPEKLIQTGFEFGYPTLARALAQLLNPGK